MAVASSRSLAASISVAAAKASLKIAESRSSRHRFQSLVDLAGADLSGFFAIGGLYNDLEMALQKKIDLVTTESLEQPCRRMSDKLFREIVNKERREIYAVA